MISENYQKFALGRSLLFFSVDKRYQEIDRVINQSWLRAHVGQVVDDLVHDEVDTPSSSISVTPKGSKKHLKRVRPK